MAQAELTLKQFAAEVERAGVDLDRLDFRRPLAVCAQLVRSATLDNFAGAHDPEGIPWLPLKRRRGQPLRDRGLLMAAATSGAAVTITSHTLTYRLVAANVLEYAGIHNAGGRIQVPERSRSKPWVFEGTGGEVIFTRRIRAHTVTIPRRQFLGFGPSLVEKIDRVLAEFVAQKVAALGQGGTP